MIIIIMMACCYVGALGPKAELILVCAAKLGKKCQKYSFSNGRFGPKRKAAAGC